MLLLSPPLNLLLLNHLLHLHTLLLGPVVHTHRYQSLDFAAGILVTTFVLASTG